MPATVVISESNGSGEDLTSNIANSNMGSADEANLDPVANPVSPGNSTYEKWQRFQVTSMGGSSKIDNLKVWRTGALGGAASHVTNARTTGYSDATYSTPTNNSSSVATETMPTSEPGDANLGIGGSLDGELTSTGFSDYLVHQIQSDASDTAGSTSTLNFQYDETA